MPFHPTPLTQLLTLHPANLLKFLFTHGAYINWLTLLAMCPYGIVTLRCVNSQLPVRLYLAAISPSPGSVVHIGYSGVCIQTPENPEPWTCSRFIKGTHGFNEQDLTLIKSVKSMQWNALYPLPALAACLLAILFILFLLFRNRSEKKTRYIIFGMWISCAIGFAGALIPMMLEQAMHYVAPVYESKVAMEISMMNIALTWCAFACYLGWILMAVWWHGKVGGAGNYDFGNGGGYGMDEEGQMEMDPRYAQQVAPQQYGRQ
jgi:hypothetical protein